MISQDEAEGSPPGSPPGPLRGIPGDLEGNLRLAREEAEYWRGYAHHVEGKLLRALDRLQEYDQAYITKLEEKLEELEAQE